MISQKEDREQEKKSIVADRDRKDQEKDNMKRKRESDKEIRDNDNMIKALSAEEKRGLNLKAEARHRDAEVPAPKK